MRNRKDILEGNKRYSDKFVQPIGKSKISLEIKDVLIKNKVKSLIDLGCGDGGFVRAVRQELPEVKLTGVDISPRRIKGLKKLFSKYKFYVGDVCDTGIKNKFDFVHSSQVIEHVPSDVEMVEEMARLLKNNGIMFCSSVIKKPFAVYKYKCNGKFALDPTHVREYRNQEEFLNLFRKDFRLIKSWVIPVSRKIFGLQVRIPGYYLVYGIWRKRK